MTQLSRASTLGIARELALGQYLAPTMAVPFTKASFEDVYAQIKDESVRGDDSILHGMYQGTVDASWDIECLCYPDIVGMFLRGMIGPDTVTPGVSTTIAGTGTAVGANSIPLTASVPAGSTIAIDTGTNTEYAITGVPTGTGPYVTPLTSTGSGTALAKTHAVGATVVSQATHLFKQSAFQRSTFSLTVFDTIGTLGFSSAAISDMQIKIDPKSAVTLSIKMLSYPSAPQTPMAQPYSALPPMLGWQWQMSNGGAASTRGISLDLTLKRATEALHLSTGQQAPREIFAGPLEADGSYKAIFENMADLALYQQYIQGPATSTLVQPLPFGGASFALTMSQSGFYKGARDLSGPYAAASFSLSGIANAVDGGGVIQATVKNFVQTAY
ncbi:hypothetical protein GCM10009839_13980 [Catenulispora yoronensis]|uniref:Uncharacterized protein n=1 Tax=Catenulispora yoronensis TaxID=450799 RepID=A0ABN2TSA3_9ACTN